MSEKFSGRRVGRVVAVSPGKSELPNFQLNKRCKETESLTNEGRREGVLTHV